MANAPFFDSFLEIQLEKARCIIVCMHSKGRVPAGHSKLLRNLTQVKARSHIILQQELYMPLSALSLWMAWATSLTATEPECVVTSGIPSSFNGSVVNKPASWQISVNHTVCE